MVCHADSLDQNEHVLYDDTVALQQAIRTLDNPLGRLFLHNQLGKAHYYMARNLSLDDQITQAAEHYIAADCAQMDDPIYRGRINSCMAHISKQNESDSLALIFFERANEAFKLSGNDWYYAHTLLDVSEFHTYLYHFAKADSVLRIAQSYDIDCYYRARFYETKGLYFYERQAYDSALVYFKCGLDLWEYEEDRLYTYKKLMQVYFDMDDFVQALPYAQIIVEQSSDPNDLVNAYYCLMQDAKAHNNTSLLSLYAHSREDANRLLNQTISVYAEATPKLEDYLQNPHPLRWVWIMFPTIILLCILFAIGIWIYRKRSRSANEQLDVLSTHIRTQEEDIMHQQSLLEFIENGKITYPVKGATLIGSGVVSFIISLTKPCTTERVGILC